MECTDRRPKGLGRPTLLQALRTPLWVSDEQWPELVHPFASAIDTELPKAPSSVHLLLRDKATWVEPQIGPNDDCFDGYPELSIEDWHKKHGLWIE